MEIIESSNIIKVHFFIVSFFSITYNYVIFPPLLRLFPLYPQYSVLCYKYLQWNNFAQERGLRR